MLTYYNCTMSPFLILSWGFDIMPMSKTHGNCSWNNCFIFGLNYGVLRILCAVIREFGQKPFRELKQQEELRKLCKNSGKWKLVEQKLNGRRVTTWPFPINCGLYVQGESRRHSMIKWKFFHLRKSRCPFTQNMLRFSLVYGGFCWCTHWHLLFVEWITPWLLKAVQSLGTILWSLFWGTDTTSWHLLLMCYTTEFVVDIDLCVAAMEILWRDLTLYLFDQ